MSAQKEMSDQEKIFGLPAQTTMRLVNIFVCTGASVVIFGAMAKILHLSWADWALKIGLTTEAMWNLTSYNFPVIDAKDWGKTTTPETSEDPLATWLVEVQFQDPNGGWTKYKVPNAEVMALMEDVKTLGYDATELGAEIAKRFKR